MLYDNWEEWTRHEQWAHQQRIWRCSEHPQHEHVELSAYEDHVKTYHPASMHQLLSSELLKSQESVSQVCDRPCPFCEREFERPADLQQHVASHLESIALLSLPNLDDIDEQSEAGKANSNSANRNYADSKAGDFDGTEPLVFLENEHSKGTPVVTEVQKELFESQLKAASVSFESMNRLNVEAPQSYSSELVRGWLPLLPHGPVFASDSPPTQSPSELSIDFGFVDLGQLCWKVYKKCKSSPGNYADLSYEVGNLHNVIKETEELLFQQKLTANKKDKVIIYRQGCEDVLKDLDRLLIKYENLGIKAPRAFDRAGFGMQDMKDIRLRLILNVTILDAFNNACVKPRPHPCLIRF